VRAGGVENFPVSIQIDIATGRSLLQHFRTHIILPAFPAIGPARHPRYTWIAGTPPDVYGGTRVKPTSEELRTALAEAESLYAFDDDPRHLAKSLLYLSRRVEMLEQVENAAQRYLHSGLAERNHTALVRALNQARRHEIEAAAVAEEALGLG
jgi:hypothetical protein